MGIEMSAEPSASRCQTWRHWTEVCCLWVVLTLTTQPASCPVSMLCFSSPEINKHSVGFAGGSVVKNLPTVQESEETWVWSQGWEDPPEEEMATHSSILAWRIPMDRGTWLATDSPWGCRARHDWSDLAWPGAGRPLKAMRMFIPHQKTPFDGASADDFCQIQSFLWWLQNDLLPPAFFPLRWLSLH